MKYFEVSKTIQLKDALSDKELKQAFLDRLQRGFVVTDLEENDKSFKIRVTSGRRDSLIKSASADVMVDLYNKGSSAAFVVHGISSLSVSLIVWYSALFLVLLLSGILPGGIETTEKSGALDVLVFMLFGFFMVYDIDKKQAEISLLIKESLESLSAQFG